MADAQYRPTVCVDFDGVIHSYISPYDNALIIPDPPIEGALEWLRELLGAGFRVCIYSSRSSTLAGRMAMERWLANNWTRLLGDDGFAPIEFPSDKPPAVLSVDDRAYQFRGIFPDVEAIRKFKPWKVGERPCRAGANHGTLVRSDGTLRATGL